MERSQQEKETVIEALGTIYITGRARLTAADAESFLKEYDMIRERCVSNR